MTLGSSWKPVLVTAQDQTGTTFFGQGKKGSLKGPGWASLTSWGQTVTCQTVGKPAVGEMAESVCDGLMEESSTHTPAHLAPFL